MLRSWPLKDTDHLVTSNDVPCFIQFARSSVGVLEGDWAYALLPPYARNILAKMLVRLGPSYGHLRLGPAALVGLGSWLFS